MKFGRILLVTAIAVLIFFGRTTASASGSDTVYHIHQVQNENIWQNYDKWGVDTLYYGIFDRPTIEVLWGSAKQTVHTDAFHENFLDNGILEIRLGETTKRRLTLSKGATHNIIKEKNSFIFMGSNKSSYSPTKQTNTNQLEVSSWRFGLGSTTGLGYKLGDLADVVLYHTQGMVWTKMTFLSSDKRMVEGDLLIKDDDVIMTIGDQIRFGTMFEGGIKIQLADFIGIKVGYERSIVFPRHLFWKWIGSEVVEGIGQGIIDQFTDPFVRMSPSAAPIVTFILKNGLSYAMYELRNKNMNWPFSTVSPFAIESFKVGVNLTF